MRMLITFLSDIPVLSENNIEPQGKVTDQLYLTQILTWVAWFPAYPRLPLRNVCSLLLSHNAGPTTGFRKH